MLSFGKLRYSFGGECARLWRVMYAYVHTSVGLSKCLLYLTFCVVCVTSFFPLCVCVGACFLRVYVSRSLKRNYCQHVIVCNLQMMNEIRDQIRFSDELPSDIVVLLRGQNCST